MFFTYVLYSRKDGKLYIGYSNDVFRRFEEHTTGQVVSTRNRRPLELIYYEAYLTETEAKRRELFLKGGKGRIQLKAQLELTFKKLHYKFAK
jgi:putative endonuclease